MTAFGRVLSSLSTSAVGSHQEAGSIPDQANTTHQSGKYDFAGIYDRETPNAYFTTLRPLNYQTPHHAQPIFKRAAAALAELRPGATVEMLDLCCGYGINGALINGALSMQDLYRHYATGRSQPEALHVQRSRDFAYFRAHRANSPLARVTGVDIARNALGYARAVGVLDATVEINLETTVASEASAQVLARADLITVTGGFSYIGANSFRRLLSLFPPGRMPWILAFPLRQTDFAPCTAVMRQFGLQVEHWSQSTFAHRTYTDRKERDDTLDALDRVADVIDRPASRTHHEAVFHVGRPAADVDACPLADLVAPVVANRRATDRIVAKDAELSL